MEITSFVFVLLVTNFSLIFHGIRFEFDYEYREEQIASMDENLEETSCSELEMAVIDTIIRIVAYMTLNFFVLNIINMLPSA